MTPPKNDWEEQFDREFGKYLWGNNTTDRGIAYNKAKSLISTLLAERDEATAEWIMENLYQQYPEACNALNDLLNHLTPTTSKQPL